MIKNFGIDLIENHDSLLLAISGGIDSMVMLDIVNKLKNKMQLKLYIAHVDHQKRPSSKDDRDFVVEMAEEFSIPCFVENLEPNNDNNFHDYAHKKRYDFFLRIAKEHKIKKVLLAHNANDNAETILMRLTRGSSFEGYRGILRTNYYHDLQIVRPLLNVTRKDIEIYQQANLVPYINDPTNLEDDYTRNRFRHHVLPLLEEENPKFLEKINQFSIYQTLAYDLVDSLSENIVKKIEFDDCFELPVTELLKQPMIIQIEVVKKIINLLTDNKIELSYQNFIDILKLANNSKPQVQFEIENQLYVYKSYGILKFRTKALVFEEYNFVIDGFKEIKLPNGYLVSITKNPNKNNGFIYKICYNNLDLVFPITVRNRMNGDNLKTKSGTKKLKDVFINKKLSIEARNSLPIFLDKHNEIIFVPGIYKKETTGENELFIVVSEE